MKKEILICIFVIGYVLLSQAQSDLDMLAGKGHATIEPPTHPEPIYFSRNNIVSLGLQTGTANKVLELITFHKRHCYGYTIEPEEMKKEILPMKRA